MRRLLLLVLVSAGIAGAAAYKSVLAIAPAILSDGDVPADLVAPMQTVLAEVISWEASMVPSIRVVDPVPLATSLERKGWSSRTELGSEEAEDARMSARQQDADAVLLLKAEHSGGAISWKAALAYRDGTLDKVATGEGRVREDDFMLQARMQALVFLDSLHVDVPAAARVIVSDHSRVPWEALMEYSRGVRDQQAGRADDALRHLREAARRAPFLPALQVRLKKLERDNPGR